MNISLYKEIERYRRCGYRRFLANMGSAIDEILTILREMTSKYITFNMSFLCD